MSAERPPHPDATRPPSPARGEGRQADSSVRSNKMQSVGARSRNGSKLARGTVKPSPLAGEGGERRSRSPGEGDAKTQKPVNKPRDIARKLRRNMTGAERKLWSLLRNRKLTGLKFRRQVPIGPYVADFLSFEARLIVEADGGQHAGAERDLARDAWLEAHGFRILRFWNSDILDKPHCVLARLAELGQTEQETAL
jgi:very-short-patch-repair endonuclease